MKEQIKKIKIRYWLMGIFFIVAVFSAVATSQVIHFLFENAVGTTIRREMLNSVKTIPKVVKSSMDMSIRLHLEGIANKNAAILQSIYNRYIDGAVTESEAKQWAEDILLSQSIGKTGYIYAIDSSGVIRSHPKPGMKNRDMSGHWLARYQVEKKTGYIEYTWKNPGETRERAKSLYMAYFEPWDWIISVSSYQEEFDSLLNREDIQFLINLYRFGRSGFSFIIDQDGAQIAGPQKDKITQALIQHSQWPGMIQQMKQEKEGELRWKPAQSSVGPISEKLIYFYHIPEMNWLVGAMADADEINEPIENLHRYILLSIIAVLSIILPLGYFLGLLVTRPFTRLADKMMSAGSGDVYVRADCSAVGEIDQMGRILNQYLDGLETVQDQLKTEITERTQTESKLHIFAKVFENAMEGISITDPNGEILSINPAFCKITGYDYDEVLGQNPRILKSDRHDDAFYRNMWQNLIDKGSWSGEIWNRRKSGEAFPEILNISAIKDDRGETTHYVAVFHDITKMKSQQEKIKYQAFHDALTGLPNRYLAQDRLSVAIKQAKRHGSKIAVLFVDMDNFKMINDSLGHSSGDLLLQEFGRRLVQVSREQDTVARLGGDEFLVVAGDIESQHHIVELAQRLIDSFELPFVLNDQKVFVSASIGITVYPEDGESPEELIKNADLAMYQSKSENKNAYHWFTVELSLQAVNKMNMARELREAIFHRDFEVYFQPKIDSKKNAVTGLEALVRWQKKDGCVVSPAEFIPLAEETGLIIELGQLVLEKSLRALQVIRKEKFPDLTMAVNLSPQEFRRPEIANTTLQLLQKYDLPATSLEFEITETTMMTDLEATISKMEMLKTQGLSISIDDFGTGYSSLNYLKRLPISALKIDKSFVDDITCDDDDAKIVETIILMAKSLGLETIAEGVETKDQLNMLEQFGCDLIQGYYFARPMPLNDLIEYLNQFYSDLHPEGPKTV